MKIENGWRMVKNLANPRKVKPLSVWRRRNQGEARQFTPKNLGQTQESEAGKVQREVRGMEMRAVQC